MCALRLRGGGSFVSAYGCWGWDAYGCSDWNALGTDSGGRGANSVFFVLVRLEILICSYQNRDCK
jgi:hypothetical protein